MQEPAEKPVSGIIRMALWPAFIVFVAWVTYALTVWQTRWPPADQRVNPVGHYVENFRRHPSLLSIYPNHTYVHLFYIPGHHAYAVNRGKWNYRRAALGKLTFSNFRFRPGTDPPRDWCTQATRSRHNRLEFWTHIGLRDYYVRRW